MSLLVLLIVGLIEASAFWCGWNYIVPEVFHGPSMTFWQALIFYCTVRCLLPAAPQTVSIKED